MKKTLAGITAAITLIVGAQASLAQDFAREIKARQALMQVYAFNIGILGSMVKGKAPYDADLAQAAANNLHAAVTMKNPLMWPKGSDNASLGKDATRAKPEAWSEYPKVAEKGKEMAEAAAAMAAAAGGGLDAVKANMSALGEGCKGCHKISRAPKN